MLMLYSVDWGRRAVFRDRIDHQRATRAYQNSSGNYPVDGSLLQCGDRMRWCWRVKLGGWQKSDARTIPAT